MLTSSSMHPRRPRSVWRATTGLFLLVAAGCSLDATNVRTIQLAERDSATVVISGAFATSSQARAAFSSNVVGDLRYFEITIFPMVYPSPPWSVYVSGSTGRLAAGTYSLSSDQAGILTAGVLTNSSAGKALYSAATGELVITSSSTSSVRGTLRFTGASLGGDTITVESEFVATCLMEGYCI